MNFTIVLEILCVLSLTKLCFNIVGEGRERDRDNRIYLGISQYDATKYTVFNFLQILRKLNLVEVLMILVVR